MDSHASFNEVKHQYVSPKRPDATPIAEEKDQTAQLSYLGLEQQTPRYIGTLETLALGWTICNSWAGPLAVLALVISDGGLPGLMYGVLVIIVMFACIVATLAELASVYPTAGGQYHWTNILAPRSCRRALSYACGITNAFSYIALCAGVIIIIPQIIFTIATFYNPSFEPKAWQVFLTYLAFDLLCSLANIFVIRTCMWIYNYAAILSLLAFIVILITCVARAPSFQPNDAVWVDFVNDSGWSSDGLVFFFGLLAANFAFTGIDGAIHLAEECVNATSAVPKALVCTWAIGGVTTFAFVIAMAYSAQDLVTIVQSGSFPSYELWLQASRSSEAATAFAVTFVVIGFTIGLGCFQTASRLTWALARDNALIGSKYLGRIDNKLEVPVWAILANSVIVLIIGCIYLGSSTAFEAFIGTSVLLGLITFAFPAAILMLRGRSHEFLPSSRSFRLPPVVGWVANFFTVAFPLIALVFYSFPTVYPVTSSNMNYTSAVIGIMGIFGIVNWFAWARKHYHGPNIQTQHTDVGNMGREDEHSDANSPSN